MPCHLTLERFVELIPTPTRKSCLVLVGGVVLAAFSGAALASTNSGIDTPQGVTSLPFAIEGNEIMNLGTAGLAIGTTTAVAPLDVYGGVRGSNLAIVAGTACSPEGMLGYDMTNHGPVYCSQSLKWTAVSADAAPTVVTSAEYAGTVSCPTGLYAVGGGGSCARDCTSGESGDIANSSPVLNTSGQPVGWQAGCESTSGTGCNPYYTYVVCAP